jgi:hypothetical protein
MTLPFRSFGAVLLCVVSVLAGCTGVASDGPTPSAQSAGAGGPTAPLPPNYRQLMARYILARNPYVIRDVKISKPYEVWGGLFRGGSYECACVVIFRDNPFGIIVSDNWVLYIENGQVRGPLRAGAEGCRSENLSPFTELKASIVKR